MISDTEILKKIDVLEPLLKEILYMIIVEIEKTREKTIDRTELNELKDIMKQLALAQVNTKETLKELAEAQKKTEIKIGELAEAQKKTEIRLDNLTQKVGELAEAQKKTEIKIGELAEAQKKTEIKIGELAEAQKKTEIKIGELAEAQKKTEEKMDKMYKEIGGISHSIGFSLENMAYKTLPSLLKRDEDIEVKGRLLRKYYVYYNGTEEQIDVYGEGIKKDGKKIYIIGEGKSQIGQKDIVKFLKKIERLKKEITGEILPLMITNIVTPGMEKLLKDKDITYYLSYEF